MSHIDDDKLKIAAGFLLDSPPGEITDVYTDVCALLGDENTTEFQNSLLPTLADYSTEQLIPVALPNVPHQVILSVYNQTDDGKFVDPRSGKAFTVDHLRQAVEAVEDWTPDASCAAVEPLRAAVDQEALHYVKDHFPTGVVSVFAPQTDRVVIAMAGNKYNPKNFWNGRWRGTWTLDTASGELKGQVKVQIHYYEEGNVQLNASTSFSGHVDTSDQDPATVAKQVMKLLAQKENAYHTELNRCFQHMSDKTFRDLRRSLPITRNKLDWYKIANYKIGDELAKR